MTNLVLAEQQGQVLEIVFNRPDKKNALTLPMYKQATDYLEGAVDNPSINVVVLRGAGTSFSAGNDIMDFVGSANNPDAIQIIIGFLHVLADFQKPIIAAVQGNAVGIGTTIMLHCDLVVAGEDLRCQMPFVKLGLIPEGGSTLLFPAMVGHRQAFELMVEGAPFDAEKAERLGVVNQVVTNDVLLTEVRARAERLSQLPLNSVKTSKKLMKKEYLQQLHRVMDEEGELFYESLFSPEAKEAFMKFLQGKPATV